MSDDSQIVFQVEPLADILEELKPIVKIHWEETVLFKENIELLPDYDKYFELEKIGILRIATARNGGKLIGYFISLCQPHLHAMNATYAFNDLVYIDESYRGGDLSIGLFQFAEEDLKSLGVEILVVSMKVVKPFDSLCEALGYTLEERTYSKYIKEGEI
jgi:hypothetical protein